MPELPEVETTIRGLSSLIGSTIDSIKIHTPKLRIFIPKNILLLGQNVRILSIVRKGKFIIINLSNLYSIVIHLGMSGRLRLYKNLNFFKKKHDHFIMSTNKEHLLVFNDARRFGFIDFDQTDIIFKRKYIVNLGIEALSKLLTGKLLHSRIRQTIVPIKQILLDQRVVSGIGNIYASEILFDAKISPFERGKDINLPNCDKLVKSIKKILKKAIKQGGSTLRDFAAADGTLGNFQNNFKVYNKENYKISGYVINKTFQYGRSTYYCPKLQKKSKK